MFRISLATLALAALVGAPLPAHALQEDASSSGASMPACDGRLPWFHFDGEGKVPACVVR